MNRRKFLQSSALSVAASAASKNLLFGEALIAESLPKTTSNKEKVDFGYAFAPPHRMTVARPESSDKTLLD